MKFKDIPHFKSSSIEKKYRKFLAGELRALFRFWLMVFWAIIFISLLFYSMPLQLVCYRKRSILRRRLQRMAVRSILYILGVRLKVKGKYPKGSFILVCNHLSWLDIPVLAGKYTLIFIAMSRSWPLFVLILKYMGMIPIERDAKLDNLKSVTLKMGNTMAKGSVFFQRLQPPMGLIFFPPDLHFLKGLCF